MEAIRNLYGDQPTVLQHHLFEEINKRRARENNEDYLI